MIFNLLFGSILVGFPIYLLFRSKHFSWTTNTIIGIIFFSFIILLGLYSFLIALEILSLPSKSFIIIDKPKKHIRAKLSFFRQISLPFDNIKAIQLSGHDTFVKSIVKGQTYKRRLYYHRLQFLFSNGHVKEIHRFLYREIYIPFLTRHETHETSSVSKHIAKLISLETGIKYEWLGTKKS
jgi:hypothetical protein